MQIKKKVPKSVRSIIYSYLSIIDLFEKVFFLSEEDKEIAIEV